MTRVLAIRIRGLWMYVGDTLADLKETTSVGQCEGCGGHDIKHWGEWEFTSCHIPHKFWCNECGKVYHVHSVLEDEVTYL